VNCVLLIPCTYLQSISFTTNALCRTIYITYIKTPTYFGTQRPSSGSYCNKGIRANLLNTLQYTTPPVIATSHGISGMHPHIPNIVTTSYLYHLERMDNTRLPKHALNYKPRGIRDRGRPRKRWHRVDAGTRQAT
jgi:hypothetical protein